MFLNGIRTSFVNILYVSRITNVRRKKLRIIFSLIVSNLSVLLDIIIILYFSYLLTEKSTVGLNLFYQSILEFLLENNSVMVAVVIFRFLFFYLDKINLQKLTLEIRESLRNYLLKEIYKRGNYSIADSTFYINELTVHIAYFYNAFTQVLNFTFQLFVYGYFLLYSNSEFSLYLLAMGLVVYFPTRILLRQARKYIHISYEKSKKISNDIQKVIENMFLIKILKTSDLELGQFKDVSKSYESAQMKNFNFSTINALFPTFFATLVFVVVLLNETVFRLITLEFVGVTLRLVQTLGSLNNALNSLINSQVHIEKLIEFENDKEVRLSPLTLDPSLNPDIAIKLEKVSFRYFGSEEYMFRNLNLDINKNKHTVLTGLNGTGKSTLIGLMSGIYYASEGTVKINSNKLGYVGPLPLILDSTIKENLNYGSSSPNSDEKLIELVELFDLFNGEDLDLNMKVTNKSLSSGQMQKISFIRAILADIEILFLDESTSNLDINTKDKIYSVLQNMNITIVNSTHSKDEFRYDFHLHIENIEGNRSISFK